MMKSVFKTAVMAVIDGNNEFSDRYKYLLEDKKYSEREARSATARQIATVVYGVMKSNKRYDPILSARLRREKLNDINKV